MNTKLHKGLTYSLTYRVRAHLVLSSPEIVYNFNILLTFPHLLTPHNHIQNGKENFARHVAYFSFARENKI